MSVSDVARLMPEVARSTVGHWFTGERKPQLDHLLKLAKVLEISAASLVADEPDYASTAEEKLHLKLMREVSPATRQAILALLKAQSSGDA
jgi:transcriptional regulator with XRE-family HTH domain